MLLIAMKLHHFWNCNCPFHQSQCIFPDLIQYYARLLKLNYVLETAANWRPEGTTEIWKNTWEKSGQRRIMCICAYQLNTRDGLGIFLSPGYYLQISDINASAPLLT